MKKADTNKPARTMYPKARRVVADYPHRVIKRVSNKKLAGKGGLPVVTKGRFKGYVIHTLTLEERATCPRHCHHWDDCFGNNMAFAHRIEHGPDLEARIKEEIKELCETYRGVIVRLHVLGDFYSVPYVMMWDGLLTDHDNLAVWGYTAHHHSHGIGLLLKTVRDKYGERWSVRFSGNAVEVFSANSLDIEKPVAGFSVACPEQTGATKSCATCTICWSAPDRRILFATH
jgi:hypothetical protein